MIETQMKSGAWVVAWIAWVVALKKVCDEEFSNIFSRFLIFRSNFWLVVACVENEKNAGGFFDESFASPKL